LSLVINVVLLQKIVSNSGIPQNVIYSRPVSIISENTENGPKVTENKLPNTEIVPVLCNYL